MKHFTMKLLVVSAIVMSLAAIPAFGGDENHHRGPQIDTSTITIKSGCIISIYDYLDGILLCLDSNCPEGECSETIRIYGTGPKFYWNEPCIVEIPEDGVITDFECLTFDPEIEVSVPSKDEFVTIGYFTNCYDEPVALWVQTSALQEQEGNLGVLLRDENFVPKWLPDKGKK